MHPRLVLDTQRPGMSRKRVFERVCDQSGSIPPRKKVKRESSKAADDSAERAAEEKMMLLGDLKHDKDFQPRCCLPETTILTVDSKSLYTRRNGRRNKLRSRKLKLRPALRARHLACLMEPKQARYQTKPPSSQFKLNTCNRHQHNLQGKYSVHQQPMESVLTQLNWLHKLPNKVLLPLPKLNKILNIPVLNVVLFLELHLKTNWHNEPNRHRTCNDSYNLLDPTLLHRCQCQVLLKSLFNGYLLLHVTFLARLDNQEHLNCNPHKLNMLLRNRTGKPLH